MPHYGTGAYKNWVSYLNGLLAANTALQAAVRAFYEINYWKAARLGEISSQAVAEWVYDHIVNAGARGTMWMQLAAKVKPDGAIGSISLAAINAAAPAVLLERANDIAGAYRLDRAHNRPDQIQFVPSWLRRDGQPESIIAMVRKAASDGVLDAMEVSILKAAMAATA
jgi:lysozyme family protein